MSGLSETRLRSALARGCRRQRVWEDGAMLESLQMAAELSGGSLSVKRYNRISPQYGWPCTATVLDRFGSWRNACALAGVRCGSRPRQYWPVTAQACVRWVVLCTRELGDTPSIGEYEAWRARGGKLAPCAALVRKRCGSWLEACEEAA